MHAIENLQAQNTGTTEAASSKPTQHAKSDAELKKVKTGTQKVLGSGIAGEGGKAINSTVLNVEKVARLADGDVNAINIK